jgi:hypothetical protein
MNDATERDFYRVENRLQGLAGRGSRDLIARVHCKLAGWAMDHGWRERAAAHYDSALHASSGDLKRRLQEIGNRFDRERFFYFDDRSHKDTTSYRWIAQHLHAATSKAVEDRLKASIRSPWTRTWTIGGGTVEGHEVQAAELQASWAGALWLLPGIQRIHAAMILEKSHEARDVARAVALWVRGNGDGAGRLIDAHEGYLTATAVSDLVESQLNYGESVERRETWVEVCQTLWDQLPDQLVDRILERFVPPIDGFDPYSLAAKELELFAFMLCRRQEVFPYVSKLGPVQLAQLTRLLPPPLLAHMDSTSAERLLVNSVEHLAELDAGWTSLGWTNLALIWRRLTAAKRHIWRDRLTDVLPSSALPEIAAAHIELPHEQQLEDALVEYGAMVREEVEQARKGTFTGWTTSPAVSLTRLNLGLERNVSEAVEALVLVATSEHTSNEQRYDALLGLRALAESNLVTVDQIRPTFRSISVSSFMTGDRAGDQRLDDMARAALRARVMVTDELNGTLLAGGRDPDGRVRQVAVASAGWLALEAADPVPRETPSCLVRCTTRSPASSSLQCRQFGEGASPM